LAAIDVGRLKGGKVPSNGCAFLTAEGFSRSSDAMGFFRESETGFFTESRLSSLEGPLVQVPISFRCLYEYMNCLLGNWRRLTFPISYIVTHVASMAHVVYGQVD
jgi:hypothetical protein